MLSPLFYAEEHAALLQTGWFVESLLSQTLIVDAIRTSKRLFIQSRASLPPIVTRLSICGVGAWLSLSPVAHYFGFTPLPSLYWVALFVILPAYATLTQGVKHWFISRFGLA
ncbi:MAG TPA: hypothetical protein DEP05_04465 [Betaproteobacteria bacterium]|nr:hypothetical protein [Betaproteobacteria bacterium]